MQRDQRAHDNWALLYAQRRARELDAPLYVCFNLVPTYGYATLRQYDFMLKGLEEVAGTLATKNIGFTVTLGEPAETIPSFVREHDIGQVVTDFNPLRLPESWKVAVGNALSVRLTEVDAHNIVPCWVASDKEEYTAATFRPKLYRKLGEFLTELPALQKHPHAGDQLAAVDRGLLREQLAVDTSVPPIEWAAPGERAGKRALTSFIDERLGGYARRRNDPTVDGQSNMSPYLHFGQLSAQRVALEVQAARGFRREDKDAFLEELIVRRELSDNFCFYQAQYDSLEGVRGWARDTLAAHRGDEREHTYTKGELEQAKTHDELWNAMQLQMVRDGKLHGWCRMYWAKKILEWTVEPADAVAIATELNDRYEIDGRDPNGYVGVLWSIGGLHDRGWTERPVFGKIRYMNYNGAKRKFNVAAYISQHGGQEQLFNE